jgi:hypothetical protein
VRQPVGVACQIARSPRKVQRCRDTSTVDMTTTTLADVLPKSVNGVEQARRGREPHVGWASVGGGD